MSRRPKRAYHKINPSEHSIDVPMPELDQLNLQAAEVHAQQSQAPQMNAPRELRALDPLVHNSQASAVPRLAQERLLAQQNAQEFRTVEHAIPPLADTMYPIIDQGIADPHVMRLSMYNIPSSQALREKTALPLGLIASPFAAMPPVADFSDLPDVPRCGRCRGYVNPATQFIAGGSKFVCNLCHFTNMVPDWYYQPTDATQRRVDCKTRPELAYGTYDLVLPSIYSVKSSPHALYVFILDVTRDSLNKGIPVAAGVAIKEVLYGAGPQEENGEQGYLPPNARVAFMSFAKELHMYRLNGESIEMLVTNDLEDPVMPPDIFFDPLEKREVVEKFFEDLPSYFKEDWEPKSCFGSALQAGLAALNKCGGRVISICASMPSIEPSKLERRDTATYTTSSKGQNDPEPELFLVTSKFYRELAQRFAEEGAGCDLFLFPTGYTDVATMSHIPKVSGGSFNFYPRYVTQRDIRAFQADMLRLCAQSVAVGCIAKVRCSLGLQVNKYWGITSDEPTGVMDSTTTFAVDFSYDKTLDVRSDAYFQVAVLYTNEEGKRHARVSNIPAGITDQFRNVLKFIDSDACMGILTRQILNQLSTATLEELRKGILEKVYQVFGSCRAYAGGPLPPTQLLMPTALRAFLPLANALLKGVALSPRSFSVDGRVNAALKLTRARPDELSLGLYPRVYPVENLIDFEGPYEEYPMVDASAASLSTCTILFNGDILLLYISANVTTQLLVDLFGVETREEVSAYLDEVPALDTDLSRKVRELSAFLAAKVGRAWLPLQVAREDLDGSEYIVAGMLLDESQGVIPYTDFLGDVHIQAKKIAAKLETQRTWV